MSGSNDERHWGGKSEIQKYAKLLSVVLLFMVCFSLLNAENLVSAQADQGNSKLQAANASVNQAFDAVQAAEKAGANVTDILHQLDVAANLLAQAENAFRSGNNSTVAEYADQALPIAQQVTANAQTLKVTSSVSTQTAFWSTIIFTLLVAVVFISILFLSWRRFKRSYVNRLSNAKPKVTTK